MDETLVREDPLRILVVGAGCVTAIGQVYGYHMQKGGAHVTFLVREKYGKALREGPMWIRNLKSGCCGRQVHDVAFREYETVCTMDEVRRAGEDRPFDVVFLTISGAALRDDKWRGELREAVGGHACVVCTTNGMEDEDRLAQSGFAEDQILHCGLTIIAWQAPLEGEEDVAGGGHGPIQPIHYTFGTPVPVSGDRRDVVERLASTMTQGGLTANAVESASGPMAVAGAILMCVLVLLEAENWSFQRFGNSPHRALCCAAANEALDVAIDRQGGQQTWGVFFIRRILSPFFLYILVLLAPLFFPFPIETYLQFHFTKVGDQTKAFVDDYIEQGKKRDISVVSINALALLNHRWQE